MRGLLPKCVRRMRLTRRRLIHAEDDIDYLYRNQETMMHTLRETLARVSELNDKVDSIITLMQGLKEQVKGVGQLTEAQQAEIDEIFDEATASAAKIDAAISANTDPPSADPAPVDPAPVDDPPADPSAQ